VTPNHVTIAAIAVGLVRRCWRAASYAMLTPTGVPLEVNSILDSCDGELARLRYQYSKLGQWLDNLNLLWSRGRVEAFVTQPARTSFTRRRAVPRRPSGKRSATAPQRSGRSL
jgi:hypothetical protein